MIVRDTTLRQHVKPVQMVSPPRAERLGAGAESLPRLRTYYLEGFDCQWADSLIQNPAGSSQDALKIACKALACKKWLGDELDDLEKARSLAVCC